MEIRPLCPATGSREARAEAAVAKDAVGDAASRATVEA